MSIELNKESVEQADASSCQGTNCGTTTGDHSSECLAEAAAGQGWELKPGDLCGRDCPIHKISVEQAGGDERAAKPGLFCRDCGSRLMVRGVCSIYCPNCVKAQARAALAQPSPAQADAERPEVVAYLFVKPDGTLSMDAVRHKPSQPAVAVMTVAQHERIVGALRAENAKLSEALDRWPLIRDSLKLRLADALARVAELELKLDKSDYAYDNDRIHMRGLAARAIARAKVFDDGSDGADAESARSVVAILRELLAVGPAQAQHSVPEGWMLVECGIWTQEQVDEMQKTVTRFRNSEFVDDRALAMAVADAGQCKAPEISLAELLAAAPGKEGV
ncbi:hypothetical protein ACK2K9_001659 [Pseudomonas aeruginosa]|nr:hypothetical protein [Pseudomonas aeruginosa]